MRQVLGDVDPYDLGHKCDRAVGFMQEGDELGQIGSIGGDGRRARVGAGERPQVIGRALVNRWYLRLGQMVSRSRLSHEQVGPGKDS
jgi:hypothetical protein